MSCSQCRYHSKEFRLKILGVADGDLELMSEHETEKDAVYTCRKPDYKRCGLETGLNEEAGVGCPEFVEPEKKTTHRVDADLERRLKEAEERHALKQREER